MDDLEEDLISKKEAVELYLAGFFSAVLISLIYFEIIFYSRSF